ncbi:Signal transduction histidine-protein kinase BarA [compost metagenome]
MTPSNDARSSQILGAFSDFPLCAPDPLAEFAERARQVLNAPIAAVWRGDLSPGQLLLDRTWNLLAAEALTLWAEIEGALTFDTPGILDLDESPWSFRSPAAKRISSLMYLPIMSSQRFLGAFIFARPSGADSFDRDELQGLRLPLQAVAFALDNDRLTAKAEVMTQRLELLTNAVPVPVCFFDGNLTVTQPNEAFKSVLGLPADFKGAESLAVWERVKGLFANASEIELKLLDAMAHPENSLSMEVEFAGDEDRHYRLMTIPFLDRQGRFTGGAMIGFDISPECRLMRLQQENIDDLDAKVQARTQELHRANEKLMLANEKLVMTNEKLRLANDELRHTDQIKTDFMSNMSHELRTPLNQIMGYGSMLQDGVTGSLTPDQGSFVDQIMEGSRRVLKLVNAILDLTRIDAGKFTLHPTWNDYPEFLANVVEAYRPQLLSKRIEITFELADDVTALWFSPEEIEQVLSNLVGNAIKFTPEGGSITLCTYRDGEGVFTEVRDTGIGISREDQRRIFDRFVQVDSSLTRDYEGSGLGLAIVKQLVELHGGSVSIDSELGRGACFKFWLAQPTAIFDGPLNPSCEGR